MMNRYFFYIYPFTVIYTFCNEKILLCATTLSVKPQLRVKESTLHIIFQWSLRLFKADVWARKPLRGNLLIIIKMKLDFNVVH